MKIVKINTTCGNNKVLLEKSPNNKTGVVFFLPGSSGGVFSDRFDFLSEACLNINLDFLRFQNWTNYENLNEKNINIICEDIEAVIDYLREMNYKEIMAIGKSFGGAMFLVRNYQMISKMVLLSPVIGCTEENGNLSEKLNTNFSHISSLLDITLDKKFLSKFKKPIRLIHGTEDNIVPLENSIKLSKYLPISDLVKINGMSHSPKTREQEKVITQAITSFFVE